MLLCRRRGRRGGRLLGLFTRVVLLLEVVVGRGSRRECGLAGWMYRNVRFSFVDSCGLCVDGNVEICTYDLMNTALTVAWAEILACSSLTTLDRSRLGSHSSKIGNAVRVTSRCRSLRPRRKLLGKFSWSFRKNREDGIGRIAQYQPQRKWSVHLDDLTHFAVLTGRAVKDLERVSH